jgi:RND family efflux transporter MFP subunit
VVARTIQLDEMRPSEPPQPRAADTGDDLLTVVERRTSLASALEAAMTEALDQDATLVFPGAPDGKVRVTRAHAELARLYHAGSVCTVPVSRDGRLVAALTLEHAAGGRFDRSTVALCEAVVGLVGPILADKRHQDLWVGARLAAFARTGLDRLFGPRHPGLKLASLSAVLLVVFLALASGEHRVNTPATLEGTVQRVVVAPIDGFVATAPARPGDLVEEGQLLAQLDDKDLRLEVLKWTGEKNKLLQEYRGAMAEVDSAKVTVLRARLERAEAELALAEGNLSRTRLTAPLRGVVVRGDLSQSLGAPVERGQTLFQVAPLDSYRVMLEVDERDVGQVRPGQAGRLALTGFPGDYLPFTVVRVTPVSTAADGRNSFAVEARLDQTPALIRPGMQGVAKIDIGQRRLIWIWSHKIIDWFRLWTWSWMPWN